MSIDSMSSASESSSRHSSGSTATTSIENVDAKPSKAYAIAPSEGQLAIAPSPTLQQLKNRAIEQQHRQCAAEDNIWVQMLYHDMVLECDNHKWRLKRKLCEEKNVPRASPRYASGVYECTQLDANNEGKESTMVMKIYVQIAGKQAQLPKFIIDKIRALERIAKLKEQRSLRAPALVDKRVSCQTLDDWVIGGFAAYIVMDKIPGQALGTRSFFTKSIEERNNIRGSFEDALVGLWRAGIYPIDTGIHNVMWDDAEAKAYIVDLEAVGSREEPYKEMFKDYLEFKIWGMTGYAWEGEQLLNGSPENERGETVQQSPGSDKPESSRRRLMRTIRRWKKRPP